MKKATKGFLKLPTTFIKTLIDFKYYKVLDKLSKGQAILYIILISFFLSIIAVIPSSIAINKSMKEFQNLYYANAPEFTIEDGKMSLYQTAPVYMINDSGKAFVVVFDDTDTLSEVDFREYESVLLLDSDSAYLRSPVGTQDIPYSTVFPNGINKEGFAAYLDLVKLTNIIFIVIYILIFILFNIIGAFFISSLGNLLLSFKRLTMKFTRSFALACYASTLPIVLKTLMHVFSLNLRYFNAIYVLVGILYFWNAANAIAKNPDIESAKTTTD